jgi:hypothetical protein
MAGLFGSQLRSLPSEHPANMAIGTGTPLDPRDVSARCSERRGCGLAGRWGRWGNVKQGELERNRPRGCVFFNIGIVLHGEFPMPFQHFINPTAGWCVQHRIYFCPRMMFHSQRHWGKRTVPARWHFWRRPSRPNDNMCNWKWMMSLQCLRSPRQQCRLSLGKVFFLCLSWILMLSC